MTPSSKVCGEDVDAGPIIVVDTREQEPLRFTSFATTTGTLQSGDYSVAGSEEHFSIERKSISDLVASLTTYRERFCRELHRLRGFTFARLLIVGDRSEVAQGNYRSKATPRSILGSLAALEVRYVPVVWSPSPEAAARQIESWTRHGHRECMLHAGLKPPPTNNDPPILASPAGRCSIFRSIRSTLESRGWLAYDWYK